MRITVTGGSGYLGSVLTADLAARGHDVQVYDIRPPTLSTASFTQGDIRNTSRLARLISTSDAIVNLAAVVGAPACDIEPTEAWSVNTMAVQKMSEHVAPSQLFVQASTGSVYGRIASSICDETTVAEPLSLYGRSKLAAEEAVAAAGGTSLRFATLFGMSPKLRHDLLVHAFVREALLTSEMVVYEPFARRTFLHVRDAAQAIRLVIENPQTAASRHINVGTEALNMCKGDLAELVARRASAVLRIESGRADPDARDYWVSYQLIRSMGFAARFSLENGIEELITHYLRHQGSPSNDEVRQ